MSDVSRAQAGTTIRGGRPGLQNTGVSQGGLERGRWYLPHLGEDLSRSIASSQPARVDLNEESAHVVRNGIKEISRASWLRKTRVIAYVAALMGERPARVAFYAMRGILRRGVSGADQTRLHDALEDMGQFFGAWGRWPACLSRICQSTGLSRIGLSLWLGGSPCLVSQWLRGKPPRAAMLATLIRKTKARTRQREGMVSMDTEGRQA